MAVIDYHETGEGEAVLFVPGSFSTYKAWRELENYLTADFRCVSISLCGYGRTEETRSLNSYSMQHEIDIVRTAIERVGSPVHLVGHSFGGAIVLATALSGVPDIRSITTFEGNPLWLIREYGHHDAFNSTQKMSLSFEAAVESNAPNAAAQIIDFWGKEGTFAAMPKPVQEYCRTTAATNVLDWRTAFHFRAGIEDYARISIPVCLVRGSEANPVMKLITTALSESLPNSKSTRVSGAGHFLINTHACECADILSNFLADVIE